MRTLLARRRELALVFALLACATVVGLVIMANQRLRFPWERAYALRAELVSAQGVSPGQGQAVTVAGVTVGQITDVRVRDGRALVTFEIEPDRLPRVHADARILVRPRTALGDTTLALDPGTPRARVLDDGDVIGAARTTPTTQPDEVLAALDADARAYLRTLLNAGGRGLRGRSADLRAILRASAPVLSKTRRVTAVLRARDRELARLVHHLRLLSEATVPASDDLARLVSASTATFRALAGEAEALRTTTARLPGTLDAARATLGDTAGLAGELAPALDALAPALRDLPGALDAVRPLARSAAPAVRDRVRPLVRAARPPARDLAPAVSRLGAAAPDLRTGAGVLERVVNELTYEAPGPVRSYLFWLAWFAHNGNSVLSTGDAHGSVYRAGTVVTCPAVQAGQPDPVSDLVASLPICADG